MDALPRIFAIALNTYREAVRARLLLGVFAVSLATCAYSLVIAAMSLGNDARVVADIGAMSFSLYGVVVAIILGSTSLYRELEYKTIFPILSRPIRRWEYLVGQVLRRRADGLRLHRGRRRRRCCRCSRSRPDRRSRGSRRSGSGRSLALGIAWWRAPIQSRIFVVIPWAVLVAGAAWLLAATAPVERQLVTASAVLGDVRGRHRHRRRDALRVVLFAVPHRGLHGHDLHHRPLGGHAGAHPEEGLRLDHQRRGARPGARRPEPARLRASAARSCWARSQGSRSGRTSAGPRSTRLFYATLLLAGGALAFQRRDFA